LFFAVQVSKELLEILNGEVSQGMILTKKGCQLVQAVVIVGDGMRGFARRLEIPITEL
jgi:hypothetical protein